MVSAVTTPVPVTIPPVDTRKILPEVSFSLCSLSIMPVCVYSCVFSEEWRWGFIGFRKEIEFGERKSNLGKENRLILLIDTKEWRWGFIRVVPSRSENSPIQKVSSPPGHSVCHMCVNSSKFRIGTRKKTVLSRFSYRSFRSLVRYGLPEEDDVLILIGFFDGFLLGVVPPVSSETAKP
ncbi:hypothetical protein L6452_35042 [Arctium lappa]|uniref:Uncharacterized protein n=1 Tax=Arctium lappa TaxID=4217 RepID=A0ACB8YJ28_ARCLA|nr:hypothetical protein L6452_35042 [Arctium lappa]